MPLGVTLPWKWSAVHLRGLVPLSRWKGVQPEIKPVGRLQSNRVLLVAGLTLTQAATGLACLHVPGAQPATDLWSFVTGLGGVLAC